MHYGFVELPRYYVDGDLELKIPFVQLVDSNTTFVPQIFVVQVLSARNI